MKGIIFTEFLELIEEKFGYETVDNVILAAEPENGGAYTSVGTYDYRELTQLVLALGREVEAAPSDLTRTLGGHLFQKFVATHDDKISKFDDAFDLLEQVEGYLHFEVKKLYPSAELPSFDYYRPDLNLLEIVYRSKLPFADLFEGLITECTSHFGETVSIQRDDLAGDGTSAKFTLTRRVSIPSENIAPSENITT